MNVTIKVYDRQTGQLIDTFSCWHSGEKGERWQKVIRRSFDSRAWFYNWPIQTNQCQFVQA